MECKISVRHWRNEQRMHACIQMHSRVRLDEYRVNMTLCRTTSLLCALDAELFFAAAGVNIGDKVMRGKLREWAINCNDNDNNSLCGTGRFNSRAGTHWRTRARARPKAPRRRGDPGTWLEPTSRPIPRSRLLKVTLLFRLLSPLNIGH